MAIISNRMLFMGSHTWYGIKYVTGYFVNINHAHIKVFQVQTLMTNLIFLRRLSYHTIKRQFCSPSIRLAELGVFTVTRSKIELQTIQ